MHISENEQTVNKQKHLEAHPSSLKDHLGHEM